MMLSIFSCSYLPFVYLLWRNVCSDLLLIFINFFFQLCCNVIDTQPCIQHSDFTYMHHETIITISYLTFIISYRYNLKEIEKHFVMRFLRNYSLNDFHIWHTAVLIIFIMLYITFLLLIYLMTGILYLLTAFIQPPPLHLLPMVTTNLTSFSMSLIVCFWIIIGLQHC